MIIIHSFLDTALLGLTSFKRKTWRYADILQMFSTNKIDLCYNIFFLYLFVLYLTSITDPSKTYSASYPRYYGEYRWQQQNCSWQEKSTKIYIYGLKNTHNLFKITNISLLFRREIFVILNKLCVFFSPYISSHTSHI